MRTTGDWSLVARQQAAVAELGKLGLEAVPLEQLLQEAARSVAEVMQVESVVLLELMPSRRAFGVRAAVQDGRAVEPRYLEGVTVPVGAQLPGRVHAHDERAGDPPDLLAEQRFTPVGASYGAEVRSGVTAMIGWDDRPWGVLGARLRHPRPYSDDDVHFLESVGNVVGLAIQRGQVEDELRERSARLDLSLAAGGLGSWHWELASNQVESSASLEQLLGLEPGTFPATRRRMSWPWSTRRTGTTARTSLRVGRRAARSSPDLPGDSSRRRGPLVRDAGTCRGGHRRRAMRVVGSPPTSPTGGWWTRSRLRCSNGSIKRRLDAEHARERLSFLAAASASLSSSLDPAVIYRRLADLVVPALCDICVIDTFDDDGLLVETALSHVRPEQADLVHETAAPARRRGRDGIWSVRRVVRTAESETSVRHHRCSVGERGESTIHTSGPAFARRRVR